MPLTFASFQAAGCRRVWGQDWMSCAMPRNLDGTFIWGWMLRNNEPRLNQFGRPVKVSLWDQRYYDAGLFS